MNRFFDNLPFLKGKVPGKIVLSALILMYAFVLCSCKTSIDSFFCVLAMVCSFIGDIKLNSVGLETRDQKNFYLGAIFFMLAHIMYVCAYGHLIVENNFQVRNIGFWIAVIITFGTFWFFTSDTLLNKRKINRRMYILAVFYIAIIGLNCSIIFSFSYSIRSIRALAALGAMPFLTSDLFIGIETFMGVRSKVIRELVWWFYPIGQILIITFG